MRITCEYCGALIDTEKASHNCCPNCGASFENNKQFQESNEQQKELDQYMLEQERIETEEKRLRLEKQKQTLNFQKQNQNTVKAMRIGCIIPIFIVVGISSFKSSNNYFFILISKQQYFQHDLYTETYLLVEYHL